MHRSHHARGAVKSEACDGRNIRQVIASWLFWAHGPLLRLQFDREWSRSPKLFELESFDGFRLVLMQESREPLSIVCCNARAEFVNNFLAFLLANPIASVQAGKKIAH